MVVRHVRVRTAIEENLIKLYYIVTRNQLADGMTKFLSITQFRRHLPLLLNHSDAHIQNVRHRVLNELMLRLWLY